AHPRSHRSTNFTRVSSGMPTHTPTPPPPPPPHSPRSTSSTQTSGAPRPRPRPRPRLRHCPRSTSSTRASNTLPRPPTPTPISPLIDLHLPSPPAPLTDDAFCARAYPGGYAHPYPPSHAHPYAHAKTRRDAMAAAVEPPADPFYVNSAWWVLRPYAVPVVDTRHAHAPQPPTRMRRIAPLPRRSAHRGVYDSPNAYKGKQREETREVWRFGTHQSRQEGEEAYAFG
ncbi:hypothetical protein B0H11DRAFT_2009218, partial [Mycena galericulata]